MAYHISHLDNVTLQQQQYFFDANMWIKLLRPKFELSARDKKYMAFFQKFLKSPEKPKIAVTSLVLSEVINRIMREVAMRKYIMENAIPEADVKPGFYKEVYRKTEHFKQQYDLLRDEIRGYADSCVFVSDSLGEEIPADDILTHPLYHLDFNDAYYVLLAKKHGFPIVTDDGDFFVEDVRVLTYNDSLYKKGKNAVVIVMPPAAAQA